MTTVQTTDTIPYTSKGGVELRWSLGWLSATLLAVIGLSIWVPSGLFLMGFLGVIVLMHEGGHLLMARRAGMQPTEFFWGFGPEIVSFEYNGCRYGIKAILAGGYVKLHGMTPTSELPEGFAEAGTYRAASHRGRLATILAGPGVNIVMAILAFTVAALIDGMGLRAALGQGLEYVWLITTATMDALWVFVSSLGDYAMTVLGRTPVQEAPVRFMSPVAQAQVSGVAVESGLSVSLRWFAVLSCAIGIINLLPLPPLDGSHAAVAVAEGALQRLRKDRTISLNVQRLLPVAYVTLAALIIISLSALVIDLRALGA